MIHKIGARELQPKNPLFWNGVAQEKSSEIAGSFSTRDSKSTYELNEANSSSISLSGPLNFEITGDHNNDLLTHINEDDIRELSSDGGIANNGLLPSISLLTQSIRYSGLGDFNKEKLCDALNTIKSGFFSKVGSQRPTNEDFIKALIILKNNLPKIIGSRENYTHLLVEEIKQAVKLAMQVLEGKLQPA